MAPPLPRRWIGLQGKVLVPVLVMLLLLLGGTLWLVNRHIRDAFRQSVAESLATADAVFRSSEDIRIGNLIERFRVIPAEPRFKAVSRLNDPGTLRAFLADLIRDVGADVALFVRGDGAAPVVASRRPEGLSQSFVEACAASAEKAYTSRGPAADLLDADGRLLDVVSIPCLVGEEVVGVLTMGVERGEAVAAEFRRLTHTEVVLVAGPKYVASTLVVALPPPEQLIAIVGHAGSSARRLMEDLREVMLIDEHFFGISGGLATLQGRGTGLRYVLLASCEAQFELLRATQRQIALIGLVGILASGSILWLVIRGATRPLILLRDAAEEIGRGDLGRRVPVATRDECGDLAAMFNQMTERLGASRAQLQCAHDELEQRVEERTAELNREIQRRERAQREADEVHVRLVSASRLAGMAEIATGVLHNVGNVLNSVNVSANVMLDRLQQSKAGSVAKAGGLMLDQGEALGTFMAADPRGRQLPRFLETLGLHLVEEHTALARELRGLQNNIDHIKQIVALQQSHAAFSGMVETLVLSELAEDALRMASAGFEDLRVEVVRAFSKVPPVKADRHKVLQILVNLLTNAGDALEAKGDPRRLVLRIESAEPARVRFSVEDNGVGIAPENLTRIFAHGFTTKKDGHGFGLHSGANAAREMGGSLTARSDGPGAGACFILELPASQPV